MPIMPPEDVQRLAEALRRSWARSPSGVDLAPLIPPAAMQDDQALIELLLIDAEERSARGLPDGFDEYSRVVPAFESRIEVVRSILMHVIAERQGPARARLIESLKTRFPAFAPEVDVVSGLCDELADSFPVEGESGAAPVAGQTLGKYRLVDRLGRGSFGEVWQALDSELDRYVALKLLYQDGARGEQATLDRALAEARAAAALAHEHIVTVHAVGRLGEIARYFIDSALVGDPAPTREDPRRIELGRSLDVFAVREGRLTITAREAARLMAKVCRGIAAAHARGVLHRDIKPANILVTPSGRPLIADFGLSTTGIPAVATGEDLTLHSVSLRSESGKRIVGTPAYMSPEQASGDRPTHLSDVYSLGATLRFVLTGAPPFKPSGRFSTDARWDVIAQVREASEPISLRGERVPEVLAAICERAMARRADDRYASAAEMADDLEAWLADRPTRALPPSAFGAGVLWFKRNSAIGVLGLAAIIGAGVGTAFYIVNIGQQRDRAVAAEALAKQRLTESEQAREIAVATSEFLDGVLASPDPRMEGKDATVLSALQRSATLIESRLKDREAVEAAVRTSVGHAFRALEDIKAARPHLDRALEIRRRTLGADHPETLKTRHELAMVMALESRVEDAIVELRDVVALFRRTLGEDHPETIQAIHDFGATLGWSPRKEALTEALEAYKEATERRTRLYGAEDRRTLSSKQGWAGIYYSMGKPAECEPMIRDIVETYRRIAGPTDFERLGATRDLAVILRVQGKNEEAFPLLQEAYDGLKAQLPEGHIDLLSAGITFVSVLNALGKGEEALKVAMEISTAADKHLGEENSFRWMTHISIGDSLTTLGRFEEAEREMLAAHANIVKVIGRDARTSRSAAKGIVKLYETWNKPDEVEKWKAFTVRSDAPPPAEAK